MNKQLSFLIENEKQINELPYFYKATTTSSDSTLIITLKDEELDCSTVYSVPVHNFYDSYDSCVARFITELDEIKEKQQFKRQLDFIEPDRDYLSLGQFKTFINVRGRNSIGYIYDLCSVLSNFNITPKGCTGKDGLNNLVMFTNRHNKDMKFYKDGIILI